VMIVQLDKRNDFDGAFNYLVSFAFAMKELKIGAISYVNPKLIKMIPTSIAINFASIDDFPGLLEDDVCVIHGQLPSDIFESVEKSGARMLVFQHNLVGEHLPIWVFGKNVAKVIPVTAKVRDSLADAGLPLSKINSPSYFHDRIFRSELPAKKNVIEWNKKKIRDIVFWLIGYERYGCHVNRSSIELKDDDVIVLGIFSRLARLKRFPELLSLIARFFPVNIRLDLYGSGSYREVSRICEVFRRAGFNNYRFMGWSDDVAQVFNSIDYLLLGRPDVEAMGINLIEAINHNVGIIAIEERPFTEIVPDQPGVIYYLDPAIDGGADFKEKIMQIRKPVLENDLRLYDSFSWAQFVERMRAILQAV